MNNVKKYLPIILVNVATMTLATLGNELVRWGVKSLLDKVNKKNAS